jgi:8-oxo-dGTP diphosphatase
MARAPIHAAGGIVVRGSTRPLIAVVQRSKDERWVLPRGKLKRDEDPRIGARREVVEETGHRVQVHEFLGAITYRVRGRAKVVQFWRMQARERPSHDLMRDIVAVEWLPLAAAVRRLSYPLEKLFLQQVGRQILKQYRRRQHGARRTGAKAPGARSRPRKKKAKHGAPLRPRRRTAGQKQKDTRHPVGRRSRRRPSVFSRMLGRLRG